MLECVVNLSEGRDRDLVDRIVGAARGAVLDVHVDPWHNRSVVTLAGTDLTPAVRALAAATVELVDVRNHAGAHPRLGALDVVPFAPIGPGADACRLDDAIAARDDFARWAGEALDLPCFIYGPERALPDVRRRAWVSLDPDRGPRTPHRTAGAACVGARGPLVAYNLWLARRDLALARRIAAQLRGPAIRALGLAVGDHVQVSCNLVAPAEVGPGAIYDAVSAVARVERTELVGLVPRDVLEREPRDRWARLDLDEKRTIEHRLAAGG